MAPFGTEKVALPTPAVPLRQGVDHHLHAGQDRSADEIAVVVAAIDRHGGSGVDNDAGLANLFVGRGDVEDPVDARLLRILRGYLDGKLEVGANPLHGLAGDLFDQLVDKWI